MCGLAEFGNGVLEAFGRGDDVVVGPEVGVVEIFHTVVETLAQSEGIATTGTTDGIAMVQTVAI